MHTNALAGDPSELPSVEGQSRSVNCHRQRDRVEKTSAGNEFRFYERRFDLWSLVSLSTRRTGPRRHDTS